MSNNSDTTLCCSETDSWKEYLDSLDLLEHRDAIRSRIEQDKHRLFVDDSARSQLEIWITSSQNDGLSISHPSSEQDLTYALRNQEIGQSLSVYVSQKSSWSRLQITFPTFAGLCRGLSLPPDFLDIIALFGYKRADVDGYFSAVFSSGDLNRSAEGQSHGYMSYNIRYVAIHCRALKNPWSVRQFAVCHLFHASGDSRWLYINLPQDAKQHMEETFRRNSNKHNMPSIIWHAFFLKYCVTTWRGYINFLDQCLREVCTAVTLAQIQGKHATDFDISFPTCQKLTDLRLRILEASDILDSYRIIANKILDVAGDLHHCGRLQDQQYRDMRGVVKDQMSSTRCHSRKLNTLASQAESGIQIVHTPNIDFLFTFRSSISNTISKISYFMRLRNDALVQERTGSLNAALDSALSETKLIAQINEKTYSQAQKTGITSLLTLAYTPAGIIAVGSPYKRGCSSKGIITWYIIYN
ncbi:hypothetical protein BDW59DRAFT_157942 [Aspergillus cavernicola]|uniref:CorA-like transporter domain-containing protein n=1 Tax=Aspergillus cavernicola TaxID=176166 RepID=A0ABR4IUU0_9EURO